MISVNAIKKSKIKMIKRKIFIIAFFFYFSSAVADISPTGGFDAPYFQADYIQDLSEWNAALVNPALLFRVNQYHLAAGFYRWGGVNPLGEELGYNQITGLIPLRLRHTLGMTFITSGSDFEKMKINQQTTSPEKVGDDELYERWIIGHYSFRLLPWLSIGCNPKVIFQRQPSIIKGEKGDLSYGFGMDIAAYGNIFDHYRFGDLGISLNFQDIIPANLKWKNPRGETARQLMTTRLRAGLRYAVMNDRLIFDSEVVIDNIFEKMWDFLIDLTEKGDSVVITDNAGNPIDTIYEEDPEEKYLDIIGRCSFHSKFQWIPQVWFKLGWANNNIPYIGFNFNIIYLWPEMINYASLDVHFGYSLTEFERGATGMIKIATDFGPTREQRESKRLYEKLILAPMNAYNEAMRLYKAEKYWEASFAFGKVLSLFPAFHLNDKCTYYLGDCYTQLRLHGIAREVYKEGLAEYTTSEMRAHYNYGLQILDYREGEYKGALKQHAFISNLYADSDVKPDADYLAGEIHFLQKNYSAASKVLNGIPPDAACYNYTQYTLAVINIENNKLTAAIQNLKNIVTDTAITEAEVLLQAAADVKLGQLYFEQIELRKAVEAFKRVPEKSEHGDEALLGIAWSWIKVNRPQECLNAIESLIMMHPNSPLIPEAYLVKGYSLILLRMNKEALEALNECVKLCKTDFASEEDLAEREEKFRQVEIDFIPAANKIKKNALRKPTDKIVSERAGLKTEFDRFDREARDFFFYSLLVEDNKKFFRREEQILSDAEYAIAKVHKIIGSRKEKELIEREIEKQEKVDDEIEKIRKELESLDEEE